MECNNCSKEISVNEEHYCENCARSVCDDCWYGYDKILGIEICYLCKEEVDSNGK